MPFLLAIIPAVGERIPMGSGKGPNRFNDACSVTKVTMNYEAEMMREINVLRKQLTSLITRWEKMRAELEDIRRHFAQVQTDNWAIMHSKTKSEQYD